ncbi:MAG: rRNA pseudouridine synthase [candidate division WOR-3 bacterium]|nr:MAG: rRNA pseudouridine synthase [candidate division WOR-3 bacterium]
MTCERLQKIIARAGITSRRRAETLISQGRVSVNGKIVDTLGMKVDPDRDVVTVDGQVISRERVPHRYFLAYKPKNMITSLADPEGRPTITQLLRTHRIRTRVYPVGRLDWDAEGLLFLTNDGDMAHRVMHPRTHFVKVYLVKVNGHPTGDDIRLLRRGVRISPRIRTLPAKIVIEKRGKIHTWFRVSLREGRQNQIKRMFAAVGHMVLHIKRIAIGPLNIGRLRVGEVRPLTVREFRLLKRSLDKQI